jgi:hypothetical protein
MNVEIGTEAPIFLFWEYLFQILGILSLQCREVTGQLTQHTEQVVIDASGGMPRQSYKRTTA